MQLAPSTNPARIGWLAAVRLVREHGHRAHKGWNNEGDMCLCLASVNIEPDTGRTVWDADWLPLDDHGTVCLRHLRNWLGY